MIDHLTIDELADYYKRRTPNAMHPKRDATIYVDRQVSGSTFRELGEVYGLTGVRISQIFHKMGRWENSARGLGNNASDRR